MKQFSVILVVHYLKGYLIAFLYFSYLGQDLNCLEGRNSGAKVKYLKVWDYYVCVKKSITGLLANQEVCFDLPGHAGRFVNICWKFSSLRII